MLLYTNDVQSNWVSPQSSESKPNVLNFASITITFLGKLNHIYSTKVLYVNFTYILILCL